MQHARKYLSSESIFNIDSLSFFTVVQPYWHSMLFWPGRICGCSPPEITVLTRWPAHPEGLVVRTSWPLYTLTSVFLKTGKFHTTVSWAHR